MRVAAVYYDGRNAKAHPVTLCLEGDKLLLQGKDVVRRDALAGLDIQPPLGSTPRVVLFADGARCEVADNRGFAELFPAADSRVAALENSWRWSGLALLLVLATAGAAICGACPMPHKTWRNGFRPNWPRAWTAKFWPTWTVKYCNPAA